MANVLHIEGKLERLDPSTPWGFRIQGGKDFGSPLTINRITDGSLAQKCGLHIGDTIIKIGNISAELLKHKDAQDTIKASGNKLDLLIQRNQSKYHDGGGGHPKYNSTDTPIVMAYAGYQPQQQQSPSYGTPSMNYNAAPKPFNPAPSAPKPFTPASAPKPFAPASSAPKPYSSVSAKVPGGGGDNPDNVRSMKNLNLNQSPADPSIDKFAALDDRTARAAGERSDNNKVHSPVNFEPKATNPALKQYNNPSGLYSASSRSNVVSSHSPTNSKDSGDVKVYHASETYRLVHEQDADPDSPPDDIKRKYSATFTKIQQQLDSEPTPPTLYQARPAQTPPKWEAPKPAPAAAPSSKPWQPNPPRPALAPSKATGVGTQRGKQGDALMRDAVVGAGSIPMCSSCRVAIRGPFVTAMNKSWCPDHFVCANPRCGVKLLDIGFVEEGGELYCEQDYERNFAPHCAKCQKAIIGMCVNALQKTWHPNCFTCAQCNQLISGGSFHVEDGKPYCEADWEAIFRTMCTSCEFPIDPGDKWVEAMDKNWHAKCFNCAMCQVNLEGNPFFPKDGKPYCKKHAMR